jgi:hypothetical protein
VESLNECGIDCQLKKLISLFSKYMKNMNIDWKSTLEIVGDDIWENYD